MARCGPKPPAAAGERNLETRNVEDVNIEKLNGSIFLRMENGREREANNDDGFAARHFGVNVSGTFHTFFFFCSQSKDLFRKIEDDEGNSRSINSMEAELEREMNKQRRSNFHEFLHVFFVVSVSMWTSKSGWPLAFDILFLFLFLFCIPCLLIRKLHFSLVVGFFSLANMLSSMQHSQKSCRDARIAHSSSFFV